MTAPTGHLPALAAAVLQPGFVGTTPPPWVCRWLGEGLGSVVLFARNVVDPAQVAALTATLRAERPDVIVAIDEEAGDVTRIESGAGQLPARQLRPRRGRRPGADRGGRPRPRRRTGAAGITLNYAPDADVNSNPANPVIGVRVVRRRPGAGRPAHRRLGPRPPVRRRRRLRQALPRPRRHPRRLAPRPAPHHRRPGRGWTPASWPRSGPPWPPGCRR